MSIHKYAANSYWLNRIAMDIRPADLRELLTVKPETSKTVSGIANALLDGVRMSAQRGVLVARDGDLDEPLLVYGVSPSEDQKGLGVCWMMGTTHIPRHARGIISFARGEIASWLKEYRGVYNFVDTRNTVHVRWLKFMGFSFGGTMPVNGVDFRLFYKTR